MTIHMAASQKRKVQLPKRFADGAQFPLPISTLLTPNSFALQPLDLH